MGYFEIKNFLRSKIVKIIKKGIVSEIKYGQLFPLDMGGRGRKRFKEDGGRGGRSSILKLFFINHFQRRKIAFRKFIMVHNLWVRKPKIRKPHNEKKFCFSNPKNFKPHFFLILGFSSSNSSGHAHNKSSQCAQVEIVRFFFNIS